MLSHFTLFSSTFWRSFNMKTMAMRYIENLFLVSETDMLSQEDESTTRLISSIDILTLALAHKRYRF